MPLSQNLEGTRVYTVMEKMRWTAEHDVCLMREFFLFEPWNFRAGSVERGKCWEAIAEQLNMLLHVHFNVCQRSVRERYQVLEKRFKAKERTEQAGSGLEILEESEVDEGMREIIDKFKEKYEVDEKKKKKEEEDREKAIEMRKRSLETLSETTNRSDESSSSGTKKGRTGSDLFQYLESKNQKADKLKVDELKLRREKMESRNRMVDAMMRQQEEQMRMFAQQAEQQRQMNSLLMELVKSQKKD